LGKAYRNRIHATRPHITPQRTRPNPHWRAARFTPQQAEESLAIRSSIDFTLRRSRKYRTLTSQGSFWEKRTEIGSTQPAPTSPPQPPRATPHWRAARFTPQQAAESLAIRSSIDFTLRRSRKYRTLTSQGSFWEKAYRNRIHATRPHITSPATPGQTPIGERPGSPHSKQKNPSPSARQSTSLCVAADSTVP
jgi:hypothetical protein